MKTLPAVVFCTAVSLLGACQPPTAGLHASSGAEIRIADALERIADTLEKDCHEP